MLKLVPLFPITLLIFCAVLPNSLDVFSRFYDQIIFANSQIRPILTGKDRYADGGIKSNLGFYSGFGEQSTNANTKTFSLLFRRIR